MVSLLEKAKLDFGLFHLDLEVFRDITFVVKTNLEYFLHEQLELPPLVKPLAIVITTKSRSFLAISRENSESGNNDGRCFPS